MQFFNISPEDRELLIERKINSLIIYDISSNKRRYKLAKLLEGYGVRVQRSCFELSLRPTHHQQLLNELTSFYGNHETDNIIIYESVNTNITRLNCSKIEIKEDFIFL